MSFLVFRELSLLFEGLGAVFTAKWFLTWVNAQMVSKVTNLIELLVANTTNQKGIKAKSAFVYNSLFKTADTIKKDWFLSGNRLMTKIHHANYFSPRYGLYVNWYIFLHRFNLFISEVLVLFMRYDSFLKLHKFWSSMLIPRYCELVMLILN